MADWNDSGSNPVTPKQALLTMRIVWAALLAGECLFMATTVLMILPHQRKPEHPQPILVWINLGMLLTVIPVAFAIRRIIFGRSRANGILSSTAYSMGNIIFWAGCEGVAFFGVVVAIVNGSIWPTLVNVAVAMALQVVTFPLADKLSVTSTTT